VVVGGLIPWLLQNNEDMPHVGTLDIDLGLDPSALADGEYASLILWSLSWCRLWCSIYASAGVLHSIRSEREAVYKAQIHSNSAHRVQFTASWLGCHPSGSQ
jgi:hypothetical protein